MCLAMIREEKFSGILLTDPAMLIQRLISTRVRFVCPQLYV